MEEENTSDPQPTLEELCKMVAELVGPDLEAIMRFQSKEGVKYEGITTRLNELLVLLEDVTHSDQFKDPKMLANHLREIFVSIDCMYNFIIDIKGRLTNLDKEIDKRVPNKVNLKSLLRFAKRDDSSFNPSDAIYDTGELLSKHGLAPPVSEPQEETKSEIVNE